MERITTLPCVRKTTRIVSLFGFAVWMSLLPGSAAAELKVGAAVIDVSPPQFPVLVNGGMYSKSADKIKTAVNARAIVLEEGKERVAIVVVDSCMIHRELLDDAKSLAHKETGIPHDRILISATHSHSAPSSMGCLGTDPDEAYVPFLRLKIAEAIKAAAANAEPARVGWGVTDAAGFTAIRRWIRRPDRLAPDPFGNPTVRANMHAGRNWDDVTGPSGPEDPDLSLISFQSTSGRPIAVLANFSMHYFGDQPVSADYFGLFCEGFKQRIEAAGGTDPNKPFVGIMSHGCSGDIWRFDYFKPDAPTVTIDAFANGLLDLAEAAWKKIAYEDGVPLVMQEARLDMKYRVPDKQRLEWAQRIVKETGDRVPKTLEEVYAREQVILHEKQATKVVVQAIRIGKVAIATTPCETYALTGLKIKAASPLPQTMVIELANGGDGYIPPPEQHPLGGYNTWPARSAGLEVQAEPRIAAAAIQLLEKVAGASRRDARLTHGPAAEAVLAAKPLAYWRLNESAGPVVEDAGAVGRDATYEPGVVFYLDGPNSAQYCREGQINRSTHFAGGRIHARLNDLKDKYTVSFWLWNGLPLNARPITGWAYGRGVNHTAGSVGEALGMGGGENHSGKLIYQSGETTAIGATEIARWTWAHVVLVRDGENVRVYLNGSQKPEIETKAAAIPVDVRSMFLGGRADNDSNWEGRLDEVAIFDRVLNADEIARLAVAP